ncbi:MAG TPA: hypothetical protein VFX98_18915 [Longimicrobiaceae bacterium]|nr:hypothetical protein [Longimicrobiaceae bacterium]
MSKLKLELEALSVESFDPLPRRGRARGTVRAHDDCPTHDCTQQYDTCGCTKEYDTCHVSCDPCATCDTSCAGGPFCDCIPSGGCESCATSCAGGPYCDCVPTPGC